MGLVCQGGEERTEEILSNKRSKQIESLINKERRATEAKVKLLLLGTGDSGKSTFLKQMKIIHKDGFSTSEVKKFTEVLQQNCLSSMQIILQCDTVKISNQRKEAKEIILRAGLDDLPNVVGEIKMLWQEKSIKDAFEKRSELHLNIPSSSDYYFENVERFVHENFQPMPEDIFRAKLKTTGITEVVFNFHEIEFTLVDVGGQRSERRKWLHCFDSVTCVIFLAALDEYDMTLEEDLTTNRLEESLRLFNEITGSKCFKNNSSWILFLNKFDLFKSKIKKIPLNKIFPDFPEENGSSIEEGVKYIEQRYRNSFEGERLYPFVTCAIDTANCKNVFTVVQDTVITNALKEAGF